LETKDRHPNVIGWSTALIIELLRRTGHAAKCDAQAGNSS
jgi:hypothetical protein